MRDTAHQMGCQLLISDKVVEEGSSDIVTAGSTHVIGHRITV